MSRLEIFEIYSFIRREQQRLIDLQVLRQMPSFIGVANSAIRTKESIRAARGIFQRSHKDLIKKLD
ncbi:MAG: hypothetical protein LBG46_03340 [Elusimicrobiota bacterium]|jgi:hypothetical protein|nr:hypothetical protein [Elusimicrobiota bacterium]